MNSAKTFVMKEQFDSLQVSVNSVNNCLNNIEFSSSVLKSYAIESLSKMDEVEGKVIQEICSTKGLIIDFSENFYNMNISKSDKPVPASFLHKRIVQIQNPVKPIDIFPIYCLAFSGRIFRKS